MLKTKLEILKDLFTGVSGVKDLLKMGLESAISLKRDFGLIQVIKLLEQSLDEIDQLFEAGFRNEKRIYTDGILKAIVKNRYCYYYNSNDKDEKVLLGKAEFENRKEFIDQLHEAGFGDEKDYQD